MAHYPGYTVLRTEDCPEQHGTLTLLTHDVSGAAVLLVENEDVNKAFGIGFGTFPSDDTGVFHILEHSVLAGSEKYPVSSPFVQLLKSSMASFLNAMTFPDKIDHLLGGDDHHAGADQLCHLCGAQAGAAGGADGIAGAVGAAVRAGRALHLLDDHLAAAAVFCTHKAARKAHGSCQHQRHGAAHQLSAIELLLFAAGLFRLLRGAVLRLLRRGGRHAAAVCRGGIRRAHRLCFRLVILVCRVHAAAAHVGVAGLVIGSGIIIFPLVLVFHVTTSFPQRPVRRDICSFELSLL